MDVARDCVEHTSRPSSANSDLGRIGAMWVGTSRHLVGSDVRAYASHRYSESAERGLLLLQQPTDLNILTALAITRYQPSR